MECLPWAGHTVPPANTGPLNPGEATDASSSATGEGPASQGPLGPNHLLFCASRGPMATGPSLPDVIPNNVNQPLPWDVFGPSFATRTTLDASVGRTWPAGYCQTIPQFPVPSLQVAPFDHWQRSASGFTPQYNVGVNPFGPYLVQSVYPPVVQLTPFPVYSFGQYAAAMAAQPFMSNPFTFPPMRAEIAPWGSQHLAGSYASPWTQGVDWYSFEQCPNATGPAIGTTPHGSPEEAIASPEVPCMVQQDSAIFPLSVWPDSRDLAIAPASAPPSRDIIAMPGMHGAHAIGRPSANHAEQAIGDPAGSGIALAAVGPAVKADATLDLDAAASAPPAVPSMALQEPRMMVAAGRLTPDEARARRPFQEFDRQETSRTRDVGACVRCKMQRVRVSRNDSMPCP